MKTVTDATKGAKALKGKEIGKGHLLILMDESGSMNHLQEAVVTGTNEILHSFKEDDVKVTLAFFDKHPGEERTRFKIKGIKAANAKQLKVKDYNPRGLTPLNDAIMDVIARLDKEVKKSENVFIAIITDGLENASETSTEDAREAIVRHEKKGWGFIYIGANQDSRVIASSYGLKKKGQSFNFMPSKGGVRGMATTTSSVGHGYMSMGSGGGLRAAADQWDATGGNISEEDEE